MSSVRSDPKQIVITRQEHNFDKAFEFAYNEAVYKFGIDDSGHCEDYKNFPRYDSSLVVVFDRCTHKGGMGGQSITYEYTAYMERSDETRELFS